MRSVLFSLKFASGGWLRARPWQSLHEGDTWCELGSESDRCPLRVAQGLSNCRKSAVGQMAFTRSGIPFRQRERVGERDGGSDLVTDHFPFLAITLVRGLDLVNIFLHLCI